MDHDSSKRLKVNDKSKQFAKLLKPLNIQDCDFTSFPDPDLQPQKPFTKLKQGSAKLYKKIEGELFIDEAELKFELRNLNIVNLEEIDIVLVSTFADIYGLPFLIRKHSDFQGKIFMTLPLAQMGKHLLEEFVN